MLPSPIKEIAFHVAKIILRIEPRSRVQNHKGLLSTCTHFQQDRRAQNAAGHNPLAEHQDSDDKRNQKSCRAGPGPLCAGVFAVI
jgi:hypothetical protein